MRLSISEPGQPPRTFTSASKTVSFGRDPQCDVTFTGEANKRVSRIHARLTHTKQGIRLEPLSSSNKTLADGVEVESPILVRQGSTIRLGFTGPEILVLDPNPTWHDEPPPATILGDTNYSVPKQQASFSIGNGGTIGRDPRAQFVLEHSHVSRKHATIQVAPDGRVAIIDLNSANGTFVNGEPVVKSRILKVGDAIDIGPFALRFDGTSLVSATRANNIQLVGSSIYYTVKDKSRKTLKLLNDVSLAVQPGEFVCILGPSGSGKSTLLGILSGRRAASGGSVSINNRDLHRNFSALKQDLAVVPQACVLHDTLTVQQSLRYTAELRLPPDTDKAELNSHVQSILRTVGLVDRRSVLIGQLSGGQLKRAGLGSELISEPSLLFLDEVTSGLDEQSDGEMMHLFRRLADDGKTLVCITHNLAHVEQNCHLLLVLTKGGRLAYFGPPKEALSYFEIQRLSDVYQALDSRNPDDWARAFKASDTYSRFVESRLPKETGIVQDAESVAATQKPSSLRQFLVLFRRTMTVWFGDRASATTLVLQALLIAFLLCLVFGRVPAADQIIERRTEIRNLLFLLGVSVFWLSCNNCVKEIVNERPIYRRERAFSLIPEAYLGAKLTFFAGLSLIQCSILSLIVLAFYGMPGSKLHMLGCLAFLAVCGTCAGLAISSSAKSESIAVALVPLAIIPQIVLAGVVADLGSASELFAQLLVPVHWAQRKRSAGTGAVAGRIFWRGYWARLALKSLRRAAASCLRSALSRRSS